MSQKPKKSLTATAATTLQRQAKTAARSLLERTKAVKGSVKPSVKQPGSIYLSGVEGLERFLQISPPLYRLQQMFLYSLSQLQHRIHQASRIQISYHGMLFLSCLYKKKECYFTSM